MLETFGIFAIVALLELPVLIGAMWLFYSRVESPWARMAVSSLLVGTFIASILPLPIGCCGASAMIPTAYLALLAFPNHLPELIVAFGPSLFTICAVIFAIRVVSYGLNQIWARLFGDRQVPKLQSSRVDERIQRRLDS